MFDQKKIWDKVLAEIELTVSKANFGTWFKNTFISKYDQGTVYLSVPNTFVRDWLINKYHKTILKSLRESSQDIRALEYLISRAEDKIKAQQESCQKQEPMDQLGLGELYINKENNLNPKYAFENFVVGPFNEIAFAAGQAVVKNPGTNYNPLYIYGPTGLGKTHLIQAIGNHIGKASGNSKKIYYMTSETFATELVNALQTNQANKFKEKYRKYDVLIMDDVQFFAGKEKSQEELFHLFNSFYENNKQIVFSSDKPPKYIQDLEERLRSRFEGGMIVDISKPDYESRLAILKNKLQKLGISFPEEIVEYIASSIQDSIRELEGALNAIICQYQAKKRVPTLTEVKTLIKNNIKPQRSVSIKDVMRIVAEFYNIEEKILFEKTRRKEVVKPRQIIMYILREDFNTSYPYIGQKLGGRDHTTVIHACEKIKGDLKTDANLGHEISQIRELLYNT